MTKSVWHSTVEKDESKAFIVALSTAEQFLISALRLWGNGRSDVAACCCRNLLRNGFQAAGLMAPTFQRFDHTLTRIDAALPERTWIAPLSKPVLNCDERRYLRIVMLCQHGHLAEALQTLQTWVPAAVARLVFGDLRAFAKTCQAVGLHLPDACGRDAMPSKMKAPLFLH